MEEVKIGRKITDGERRVNASLHARRALIQGVRAQLKAASDELDIYEESIGKMIEDENGQPFEHHRMGRLETENAKSRLMALSQALAASTKTP